MRKKFPIRWRRCATFKLVLIASTLFPTALMHGAEMPKAFYVFEKKDGVSAVLSLRFINIENDLFAYETTDGLYSAIKLSDLSERSQIDALAIHVFQERLEFIDEFPSTEDLRAAKEAGVKTKLIVEEKLKAIEPEEPVAVTKDITEVKDDGPKPLKQWTGNGIKTTQKFTVKSGWTIGWATVPSDGFSGVFQIFVYDSMGNLVDIAANVVGRAHDASIVHKAGTFYLQMNSSQTWSVSVYE